MGDRTFPVAPENILILAAKPGQTSLQNGNVPESATNPGQNSKHKKNVLESNAFPGQSIIRRETS